MLNFHTLLLGLLLASVYNPAAAQQNNDSRSLLWQVSGNGLSKPWYIFGAVDFICPGDYLWTDKMQAAFAGCEEVYFELNTGDTATNNAVKARVMNKNGQTLADYFQPATYDQVRKFAKNSMRVDLDRLQQYNPKAIQKFLISNLLGCIDAVSYNSRILELAKKAGKKVAGLQTADEQLDKADKINYDHKIAATIEEVAGGSTYYHEFRKNLVAAYKQQDLPLINSIYHNNKLLSNAEFNALVIQTNREIVNRLPAAANGKAVFFALGVVNLGGDEGVLNMLRNKGYHIEAIK